MTTTYLNREIINELKNISKSLNTLAEEVKANRERKDKIIEMFNEMEKSIQELREDPFGLNEGDS